MELAMALHRFRRRSRAGSDRKCPPDKPNLTQAQIDRPVLITGIDSTDQEMIDFLFTLGCFAGETITLISILADNYIIHVKGARYSIDTDLAKAILI